MCAQHMSRRDLNTLIDTALTTHTGSLFQALPNVDNSHREEFQSSSGGTSLFFSL